MRCLLLDAAMRPMTLVSRERAVSLVVCGNAQVIGQPTPNVAPDTGCSPGDCRRAAGLGESHGQATSDSSFAGGPGRAWLPWC